MRRRDATPFLLHAIAVTGGLVEWEDKRAPTYDGARWHFARLGSVEHALHEIAHWICAPAAARALPNYGLGTDPDGGPETLPDLLAYVIDPSRSDDAAAMLADLLDRDPMRFVDIHDAKMSREEELAAVVTVILLRRAGMKWGDTMRRIFRKRGAEPASADARFWGFVAEVSARGVDLDDPLRPFEMMRGPR